MIKQDFSCTPNSIVQNIEEIEKIEKLIDLNHIKMKTIFSVEEKIKGKEFQQNIRKFIDKSKEIYSTY